MSETNTPLSNLTDEVLSHGYHGAVQELKEVAEESPNSEWHEACFAAVIVFGNEMVRRGLRLNQETLQ